LRIEPTPLVPRSETVPGEPPAPRERHGHG
jgi:hypothetical protein